jgi:purine-binding chemotaxis protein CheW
MRIVRYVGHDASRKPGECVPDDNVLLIFAVDELRLGIPVASVERVLRAVEVTPLADAPATVPGVVNVQGRIVPVVDLRARFGMRAHAISPDDHFLLVALPGRTLAVLANEALDVRAFDMSAYVPAAEVLPWLERIDGVVRLEDGLLLVTSADALLNVDEWQAVAGALERAT